MPVFTLITWNMQGGNDNKWSRIFDTRAEFKCLQECSSPPSQFKDRSEKAFAETSARTVELSFGMGKDGRGTSGLPFSELKAAVSYAAQAGHKIRVTKFATYGDAMVKRYQRQIDDAEKEYAKHKLALDTLLNTPGHQAADVECLKQAMDAIDLERPELVRRRNKVALPADAVTGAYRSSRCNTAIAYKENDTPGKVAWVATLRPAKPEFQRYVQCLQLNFGNHGRFIIFNIHSVASGAAWSYLRNFIPEFDSIAHDFEAVAWLCLGDFNLDALAMKAKIDDLAKAKARYPHRRVIYSDGVPTHFSANDDPKENEAEVEDRDFDEGSREKMSQMIKENSPDLKAYFKGRNLDYMIMSTPLELPEEIDPKKPLFPCEAGVVNFLSDHRPVEFIVDTVHFDAIQSEISRVRQERVEWIRHFNEQKEINDRKEREEAIEQARAERTVEQKRARDRMAIEGEQARDQTINQARDAERNGGNFAWLTRPSGDEKKMVLEEKRKQ